MTSVPRRRARLAAVVALLTFAALPAPAGAATDPGPALSVPRARLDESLVCTGVERGRPAVLLIHGTALTPAETFAGNYEPSFRATGRAFCTVALPERAMADIQVSAEYVVAAIRTLAARTGQPVSIVGHSQGGMIGRWALKYWPDTRTKVTDLIGLAPSNHGTLLADGLCASGCAPSIWQQRVGSTFLAALNADAETYAGIDYTVIFTHTDGVLIPAEGAQLTTGGGRISNIAVTDVCPARYADHLTVGTFDAAAYALAIDALDNDGPAEMSRFDAATCLQPFQPGVDPATVAADHAAVFAAIAGTLATTPHVPAEPALRAYASR